MRTKNDTAEPAMRNAECGMWNAESATRNAESAMRNVESAPNCAERFSPLRNPQCGMRNPQEAMRNSAFRIPQKYEPALNLKAYLARLKLPQLAVLQQKLIFKQDPPIR